MLPGNNFSSSATAHVIEVPTYPRVCAWRGAANCPPSTGVAPPGFLFQSMACPEGTPPELHPIHRAREGHLVSGRFSWRVVPAYFAPGLVSFMQPALLRLPKGFGTGKRQNGFALTGGNEIAVQPM